MDNVAVGVCSHTGLYRNAEVWQDVAVCHDSYATGSGTIDCRYSLCLRREEKTPCDR
ncbi:hypothetical protein ACE414_03260 [Alteromonas macleodii]|uniref:hypothetical protein n=1 Tax=Alteromonas macleodii TaxID=28108 RepID=UPI00364D6E5D